jgi:Protein of unknown function (DUF3426).
MIITCPHCQTKYQVTYEAIGSAGRKVQCAHCHRDWDQAPVPEATALPARDGVDDGAGEDDRLFDAMTEDVLDEVMMAEEAAVAREAGVVRPVAGLGMPAQAIDAAALKKQQMAFRRRQDAMFSSLPMARLRRAARAVGVLVLAGIVGGAWFARVPIVERYPDLAGLYEAVGLGVNVVGLDFSNLHTLKSLSGGNEVLTVSAQIVGRSPTPVRVPPVVISLLDANGDAVFEWSVAPRVSDLMAGERATFDTRLSLPPSEAVRVRLSFAGMGSRPGERGGAGVPAALPEPSLAEALSVPASGAPAPILENNDAAPAPVPAPAASDHH